MRSLTRRARHLPWRADRPCRAVLAVLTATALTVGAAMPAVAQSPEQGRLRESRARVEQVRSELDAARGRQATDAASLARAQAQLDTVIAAVRAAESAVQRQQRAVATATERLEALRTQESASTRVAQERAVDLYMRGTGAPLESVLASGDAGELLDRSSYVEVLSREDRRAIEGLGAARTTVDAGRDVLAAEQTGLAAALAEQQAILAQTDSLRDERQLQLAATSEQLAQLQLQEQHAEAESRELAALARRASLASAEGPSRSAAPAPAAAAAPAPAPDTAPAAAPASAPARVTAAVPPAAPGDGAALGASGPARVPEAPAADAPAAPAAEAPPVQAPAAEAPPVEAPAAPAPAPAPAPDPEPEPEPEPASGSGGWVWPAAGPVTSNFGQRWGRAHEGIDIGAPTGAAIVAARSGTVAFAGAQGGYGNLVLIDHGDGIVTAYAHQSRILVSAGQSVGAGGQIGAVGSTGNSTGPHLHFEVRVGGAARDPMGYLG